MQTEVFQGFFIKLKAFKGFTGSEHPDKDIRPHLGMEPERKDGPQPLLLAGMGRSELISLV